MPTYDYVCRACGHEYEEFHSIAEPARRKCPRCGKPKLERRIGPGAGILFRGSGFYQTDYRSESYRAGEKAAGSGDGAAAGEKAAEATPPEGDEAGKPAEKSAGQQSEAGQPAEAPKKTPPAKPAKGEGQGPGQGQGQGHGPRPGQGQGKGKGKGKS